MENSKEISTRKKWIYSLLIIVLPFVIGEVALRLIMDSNTALNINLGGNKEFHPVRKTQLIKNYRWKGNSINSKRMLGSEFEIKKEEGKLRVLSLSLIHI